MTLRTGLFVAPKAGGDGTDGMFPQGARLALASLFSGVGVLKGAAVAGSTSGPNMQYTIAAGTFVTARSNASADGVYMFANDGPVLVTSSTPAPNSGTRWDLIWVRAKNGNDGFSDANSSPEFGVTVGSAGSTPSKPYSSVPAGALVLAEASVGTNIANASLAAIGQVAAASTLNPAIMPVDDTGWVACGPGNGSVAGTAKVRREGNKVYGKLSLSFSGGWPNSQVTAFTLPDTSYSPGATHRMNMGAAVQVTPSSIILTANPAANAVFAGANGAVAGSQIFWNSLLWLTD